MKIAIFIDAQGAIAPLTAPGTVTLYHPQPDGWQVCRKLAFDLSAVTSLAEIRERTLSMLAQLPDCHHFVAHEIHGAQLAWLDGMGLTMWQFRGTPEQALAAIARQQPTSEEPVVVLPEAFIRPGTEEGEFYVDLIAALRCGGDQTSKRLLLPLLQREAFRRLELRCDHVPKWFSRLEGYQFAVSGENAARGELQVIVSKTAC